MKVCLCVSGPGSKRLGIDGDREAVPLTLQIIYSKVRRVLGLLTLPQLPVFPGPSLSAGRLPWREGEGGDILLPPPPIPPDVLSTSREVLGPGCRAEGERGRGAASRGRARALQGCGAQWGACVLGPGSEGNHRICGVQEGGVAWVSEHHTRGTCHESLDLKMGIPQPPFFPSVIQKILI